jgi:hypothetical protein
VEPLAVKFDPKTILLVVVTFVNVSEAYLPLAHGVCAFKLVANNNAENVKE